MTRAAWAGSMITAIAIVEACASEGFPPGGPEDRTPPVLVESSPADRAVNAAPDQAITLRFDEAIDDRQLRQLPALIRVNPDEPKFDLILDGREIKLRPLAPMLEGVTYTVTILPGVKDREGNATVQPRTILFSIGGVPITLSLVRATIVRDTVPVPRAFYRLENQETGFGYTMVADSQGQVVVEGVAYGPYVATAWEERVRPEGWQMMEEAGAQDTFALGPERRSHQATYRIMVRDTTPPIVRRVETLDGRTLRVTFDDSLSGSEPAATVARLWQAEPRVADVPLDSIPLAEARSRPIAIDEVRLSGPDAIDVVAAVPLERGAVYRIEIVGVENRSGLLSNEEGGRTFRAQFEGPRRFRAEPIPWPEGPP